MSTLWTGGYATPCNGCGTPLLTDEEERGVCDNCRDKEALRTALRRPDFSHVSYGRWCGVDLLHVYRRAQESPSGCELVAGFRDTPTSRQVLAEEGTRAQAPGQMGFAACSGRTEKE